MKVIKKYGRLAVPFFVFIILTVFLWRGLYQDPHLVPSPLINHTLTIFPVASLDNVEKQITLADFQGHVTLLNVFATWCLTCHTEHPILMDIARSGDAVVAGLDYKDNRVAVMTWLEKYGRPYQHIIDDPQGKIAINLGVYGTPETFIIDRQGVIRDKYIGPITPQVWQNILLPEIKRLQKS